jgi:hypothetical protein
MARTKHGQARLGKTTRAYQRWKGMLGRCYNPKNARYPRYGGRGITVCEQWRQSFEAFYADMGDPPPGLTLERTDNMRGYSPENCVWATPKDQSNTRHTNHPLTYQGVTLTLRQWEHRLGYPRFLLQTRLQRGWSEERAITTPPNAHIPLLTYKGKTMSFRDWNRELGLSKGGLESRIAAGWTVAEACETPPHFQEKTLTHHGQTKSLSAWNRTLGFSKGVVEWRLAQGWTLEEAFSTPKRGGRNEKEKAYGPLSTDK